LPKLPAVLVVTAAVRVAHADVGRPLARQRLLMVSATWLASVMLRVAPVAQTVAFARHHLQMVQGVGFNQPAALQVMVPAWQLHMLTVIVLSHS
jgi:hypothetical protein